MFRFRPAPTCKASRHFQLQGLFLAFFELAETLNRIDKAAFNTIEKEYAECEQDCGAAAFADRSEYGILPPRNIARNDSTEPRQGEKHKPLPAFGDAL